jgi:alginate O-acetyltransferase complex protein AlgJ
LIGLVVGWAAGCRSSRVSWPAPEGTVAAQHAEVRTVSTGYQRSSSQVLVRAIDRPTRATLDWAAYHANFMNTDPAPEGEATGSKNVDVKSPFGGTLEAGTLTATIRRTPLTGEEQRHPLALAPMVEWLTARKADLGAGLEEVVSAVRSESWGLGAVAGVARQSAVEAFLHDGGDGKPAEVWVKVEVQPWFKALGDLPDEDGDGVPELYGRVRPDLVNAAALKVIREDYAGKTLSPAEIKAWANQLASYWYPSYNTDLVPPPRSWPDGETEEAIKKELGGATFAAPTVVMRGKPQGKPTYNVFVVGGVSSVAAPAEPAAGKAAALVLPKTPVSAHPEAVMEVVKAELGAHGGSWSSWGMRLLAFQEAVRARLRSTPAKVKGLPGAGGYLFFRNELDYVVGGDLEKQAAGKNPLPVIVEFKDTLAARGVDFLFVPVPNKVEVFPDRFEPKYADQVGQVVAPFGRKLLVDLGTAGVEAVDLLPAFLEDRARDPAAKEPLYQAQDTHWTRRGLELAARLVAERIKKYPWYADLAKHARKFGSKEASFARHGDLHSRLPPGLRGRYRPEALVGDQVVASDGKLYEDDPDSPIVVLGDSFTGVYELTECEHAGVSAHIAKEIGYPVDLVMSYGGGPNVRQKLLRRGIEDLGGKRLVVWMMTARDLYHYWENWEPLKR